MINIVLFEPEIPQNTGNIMRTCAGTGCYLHLIKPLGFSLDEKNVRRSAVNYMDHCDFQVYENFEDFKTHNEGTYFYLTRYGRKPHTSFDYQKIDGPIYFIFGKESTGIPKEILRNDLDHCMRIPMNEHIRALNLSNSVAVMIFEVLRQLDYPDLLKEEPFKGADYLTRQ